MKNGMNPCPFCGSEDIRIHSIVFKEDILMDLFHYKADVICGNCRTVKMCVVSGKDEEDCKEKIKEEWNKRSNV